MQLRLSPSMRSITISSNNSKMAARHFSYRTLFYTILILAFLLPFLFILTPLVTLKRPQQLLLFWLAIGTKVSWWGDDTGRLDRDFYKILNQVNTEEIPEGLKLLQSFTQLVSEMKKKKHTAKEFTLILKGMMERSEREIRESKFAELMNKHFAASVMPFQEESTVSLYV